MTCSWDQVVQHEVSQILQILKKNIKWSVFSAEDSQNPIPFLNEFMTLRRLLDSEEQLKTVTCSTIISPFIVILRSESTTGPVIEAVLNSIEVLILRNVLEIFTDFPESMLQLTEAISSCRFEATDAIADEIVLMKILRLLKYCYNHGLLRDSVSNESIYSVYRTGFTICFQMRLSENLRRYAEMWLQDAVVELFVVAKTVREKLIADLLNHLISLIKLNDLKTNTKVRIIAASLICKMLEVGLPFMIKNSYLLNIVADDLCRNLIQGLTFEYPAFVSILLKCCQYIFNDARKFLRYQLEYFLHVLIKKLSIEIVNYEDQNTEIQELYLECIYLFVRQPNFVAELMVNYDCDNSFSLVFDELVRCLAKLCISDGKTMNLLNILAFRIFVVITGNIKVSSESPSNELESSRRKKLVLFEGADRFNLSPKDGIKFLESNKIISENADSHELAHFLKTTKGINKKQLGEYLSKPSNHEILFSFIQDLEFKGKRIDEALRLLLEAFRLPGEAQQISCIMEKFADVFYATKPEGIASRDAVYVLAYSVILLNTDQHNRRVRNKMSADAFKRNNRGVNEGNDFPEEYLMAIYEAIKSNEIVMPEEQEGEMSYNYTWNELIKKSKRRGSLIPVGSHDVASLVFGTSWNSILQVFIYVLETAETDYLIEEAKDAIEKFACIASSVKSVEAMDTLIGKLFNFIGLPESKIEILLHKENRILHDSGAYLAMILLFKIFGTHGNCVEKGWKFMIQILGVFHHADLLPKSFDEGFSITSNEKQIITREIKAKGNQGSLFSNLSQYLTLGDQDSYNVTEKKQKDEIVMKCLESCNIDGVLVSTIKLNDKSFCDLVKEFIEYLRKSYEHMNTFIVLLEKLTDILVFNLKRLALVWSMFIQLIKDNLNEKHIFIAERSVICLLRLFTVDPEAFDEGIMSKYLFDSLLLLKNLSQELFNSLAESIVCGLKVILKNRMHGLMKNKDLWNLIYLILSMSCKHNKANKYSLECTMYIMEESDEIFQFEYEFGECVDLLLGFIAVAFNENSINSSQKQSSLDTGISSLNLLFKVHLKLCQSYKDDHGWSVFFLPVLCGLGQQVYHPSKEIRQTSITLLQRALLLKEFQEFHGKRLDIFDKILFPLLIDLTKPEVFSLNPSGISETKMRAYAMVCKIFLQFLSNCETEKDLEGTWKSLLDITELYIKSDLSFLKESISESITNVLLVMFNMNLLGLHESNSISQFTWQKLNSFMPSLQKEFEYRTTTKVNVPEATQEITSPVVSPSSGSNTITDV